MKVFYFCTHSVVRRICGIMGKGRLCSLIVEYYSISRCAIIGSLLCYCCFSSAQQTAADSVLLESQKFHVKQLIVPSAMIAVGAWGVSNGWFCSIKHDLRDNFHDLRGNDRFRIDDQLQYLPIIAGTCLGLTGIKTQHEFKERIAITATSYAVMGIIVNTMKYAVNEKRPDTSADNSFPSGHTATAFMGAEMVRQEYGNVYGVGAYAFATGIAFLRLYNDRHWLNDVIAGAGIGILSTRMAYWLLPWERKLFGWDKTSKDMVIIPTFQYNTHTVGLTLNARL